jgi:hypothetical protein
MPISAVASVLIVGLTHHKSHHEVSAASASHCATLLSALSYSTACVAISKYTGTTLGLLSSSVDVEYAPRW